jgi:hypothetical protein
MTTVSSSNMLQTQVPQEKNCSRQQKKYWIKKIMNHDSNTKLNSSIEVFCTVATKIFNSFEQQDSYQEKSLNNAPRWKKDNHEIPLFADAVLHNKTINVPSDLSNKILLNQNIFGMVDLNMKKECFSPVKLGNSNVILSLKMGYPKKQFQGLFEIDGLDSTFQNGGFTIYFENSDIGFLNSFDGTSEGFYKKIRQSFKYIIDNQFIN